MMYPEFETYDERESDRWDSLALRKARAKGNPKKKRTAEGKPSSPHTTPCLDDRMWIILRMFANLRLLKNRKSFQSGNRLRATGPRKQLNFLVTHLSALRRRLGSLEALFLTTIESCGWWDDGEHVEFMHMYNQSFQTA